MLLDNDQVDGEMMPNSIPEMAAGMVIALIAIAFGLQKLFKSWKETNTESSVMTIMHTELERMARQNATLSKELNKLQLEIVELNRELRKLTVENQRLHSEVQALTGEVTRLQLTLTKYQSQGDTNVSTN